MCGIYCMHVHTQFCVTDKRVYHMQRCVLTAKMGIATRACGKQQFLPTHLVSLLACLKYPNPLFPSLPPFHFLSLGVDLYRGMQLNQRFISPACQLHVYSQPCQAFETQLTLKGNNRGLSILLCQSRNGSLLHVQSPARSHSTRKCLETEL